MIELPDTRKLETLLKMCRRQGVTELTLGEMSLKLGDLPREPGEESEEVANQVMPSDEEMAYWSAQPDPLAARLADQ